MPRIDQVNSLLRQELALSLNRLLELPGGLVTVTDVQCTPDLREAQISVSVLPEHLAGTALGKLRRLSGELARDMRKRLKFHHMPILVWSFDERPSRASAIEEIIKETHD